MVGHVGMDRHPCMADHHESGKQHEPTNTEIGKEEMGSQPTTYKWNHLTKQEVLLETEEVHCQRERIRIQAIRATNECVRGPY